eukprot:COSAG03_NODE_1150_length_4703_cov_101.178106_1_plen_101_part_00
MRVTTGALLELPNWRDGRSSELEHARGELQGARGREGGREARAAAACAAAACAAACAGGGGGCCNVRLALLPCGRGWVGGLPPNAAAIGSGGHPEIPGRR